MAVGSALLGVAFAHFSHAFLHFLQDGSARFAPPYLALVGLAVSVDCECIALLSLAADRCNLGARRDALRTDAGRYCRSYHCG